MDMQTVEQQYTLLQQETHETIEALQNLARKLKAASDKGDADAGEWLLDLREIALNIQKEQRQALSVMQAVHQAVQNDMNQQQKNGNRQSSGYSNPQSGGYMSQVEHSGFGRAILRGAGFGIGDAVIRKII